MLRREEEAEFAVSHQPALNVHLRLRQHLLRAPPRLVREAPLPGTPSPASNHVRLRDNEAGTLAKDAPPPKKRDKRLIDLMHLEMSR